MWFEFLLKVKVIGSNPGYLLKSFLLYEQKYSHLKNSFKEGLTKRFYAKSSFKNDNNQFFLFNLRSDSEASSRTATKVSTAATTIKSMVSKRGSTASFTPSATSSRFPFTQRWELPMAGVRKKSICKQNYISATFG